MAVSKHLAEAAEDAKKEAKEAKAAAKEEKKNAIPEDKDLKKRYSHIPGMGKDYKGQDNAQMRDDFYKNGKAVGEALGIKDFDKKWSEVMQSSASEDGKRDKERATKKFEKEMKKLEKKDPVKYAEVQEKLTAMTDTMEAFDEHGKSKYRSKTLQQPAAQQGLVGQAAKGAASKALSVAKTAMVAKGVSSMTNGVKNAMSHNDKVAAAENLSSGVAGGAEAESQLGK